MKIPDSRLHLASQLRRSAEQIEADAVDCPMCGHAWVAPATHEGGPLLPVKLNNCPYCNWIDPAHKLEMAIFTRIRKRRAPSLRAALMQAAGKMRFPGRTEHQKKSKRRGK